MNFFSRFFGIHFRPKQTCQFLEKKPVWIDTLIILLIAILAFTYVLVPYTRMLEGIDKPARTVILTRAVIWTHLYLLGFLVSSLVLLILSRAVSKGGNYSQVFSVYIHANLIDKILGNAVRLFLLFSNKSIFKATTSIAVFFPNFDVHSLGYAVAIQFDIFQLWMFAVLSLGLAAIFKMKIKKALFVAFGFWFLKALLNIVLISLEVGFIR
ncbi:YIP1 family protein [Acidobacteriota bacterium]